MRLTYTIANDRDNLLKLASLILKHHLCVSGWMLQDILKDNLFYNTRLTLKQIVIAYYKGIPIGTAVLGCGGQIMVFVTPSMRRKCVGTKMLHNLNIPEKHYYLAGIPGSRDFYKKALKSIKRGKSNE